MRVLQRLAVAAGAWALWAAALMAQNPPQLQRQAPSPAVRQPATVPGTQTQATVQTRTAYRPTQYQQTYQGTPYGSPDHYVHPGNQSVLRRQPVVANEYSYGFRNPGGVGRMEEYYPPYNQFQNGGHDPTVRAGFNQGLPTGSVEEQAMAYNAGTARYQAYQNSIDTYARPLGGYGFGYGFGVPF
jgi:hypothetical protein